MSHSKSSLIINHHFHPSILREYDIRGIFDETLSIKDAYWIGRCFAHRVKEERGEAIAVCRDGRLSSLGLEEALMQGLCDAGLTVYRLGVGPTPMLYFAEYALPVDAAVMVTGSHNPPTHNGFKMSLGRKPFFSHEIFSFAELVNQKLSKGQGRIHETSLSPAYVERLLQDIHFKRELSIAWDPGNGATADILKQLVKKLPGTHFLLNEKLDGRFPGHPPDPSDPQNLVQLQQMVLEKKCDLGIAFDGDGDRLLAVDSQGRILWGDQLLLLFAQDLLAREPGATIIGDIKGSQVLFDEIRRLGGHPLMWRTGHSYIKEKMALSGAKLAGEMSGHFFFKENYYGYDDGLYAALQLVRILSQSSQHLSTFYDELPSLPSTPELRIDCDANRKFAIPENIKLRLRATGCSFIDIDGIRFQNTEGWWLLRASHTQDVLVARCEAYSTEGLKHIIAHLKKELEDQHVSHPFFLQYT